MFGVVVVTGVKVLSGVLTFRFGVAAVPVQTCEMTRCCCPAAEAAIRECIGDGEEPAQFGFNAEVSVEAVALVVGEPAVAHAAGADFLAQEGASQKSVERLIEVVDVHDAANIVETAIERHSVPVVRTEAERLGWEGCARRRDFALHGRLAAEGINDTIYNFRGFVGAGTAGCARQRVDTE